MPTAVVSDLHLGKAAGHDLLRRPEIRARLLERLADADRLVLLGDVVELREGPLAQAMAVAEPFFRALGDAIGPKPVTLLCGNHDYQLAAPLLDARALDGGRASLAVENTIAPKPGDHGPLARIVEWMAPAEVTLAYPGAWIRDDVFATHGHYLDWHNTVPTIEVLAIGIAQRVVAHRARHGTSMTPGGYEAALAPVYELAYTLAQSSADGRQLAGGGRSVNMWERLNGTRGGTWARIESRLAKGAAIPAAVGALNKLGLGPLKPDLDATALRRAGLASMGAVVSALGIEAQHVIFGHTHRSGPWPRDREGWDLPGGGRLWNSGSWIHEPVFLGPEPTESPYFPGVVVWVDDEPGTPPRLERVLEAHELPVR
jgi:calcineurin-like phosphoesterase family protein